MFELPNIRITSEMLWLSALVTAIIDIPLVLWLARRIGPARFRSLHWPTALAAAIFWLSYELLLYALTWDFFYAKLLPSAGGRSLVRALLELAPYPAVGLLLWWLASRLPGNPTVTFCLLGGLESLPEHLWGIYRLGMLDKVPYFQGVSPASMLAFAVFEYILYWGSVLSLAAPLRRRELGRQQAT
ncbi:MAG TPA: hypothetical protein PLJ35_12925 [Anaerolineae bacterium]|nr:hypothetical protein [Anaerolineae bacterium]HOQ99716.1 hypothetical protein [Anaerolineae bacterium]HPL26635.1 hypothetical protein [Anaerolineae bacterium]